MKADNPVMTSLFYRRISVPSAPIGGSRLYGATIGGECIWRIALKTAYDTCLPVSALGTLLHRRPDAAEKNNLEATFKTLESAYATRIVPCYFNRTLLIAFGLREVLGLSTPIKDPEHALESIFQIIQNRKYFVGPKIQESDQSRRHVYLSE